ncbi:hypothetical protein [Hyphomonas sp.]|uniref:hypothetical protein n=1 Tax=Hyphomonas sp. TaxID=87 RepID=UPI00391A2A08
MGTEEDKPVEPGQEPDEFANCVTARYVWWSPTLASGPIVDPEKSTESGVIRVAEMRGEFGSIDKQFVEICTAIRYAARGDGIFVFEVKSPAGLDDAQTQLLRSNGARWVSERLGHQHIFHHNEAPAKPLGFLKTHPLVGLLSMVFVCVIVAIELEKYGLYLPPDLQSAPWLKAILEPVVRAAPLWFSIYLSVFCSVWIALGLVGRLIQNVGYFLSSGFLLSLNISTFIASAQWIACWSVSNFLPNLVQGNSDIQLGRLITELKPRLLLGPSVSLDLPTLGSTMIAAALLGLLAISIAALFSKHVLKLSDQGHSLHRSNLAADVPTLVDHQTDLTKLLTSDRLRSTNAALLNSIPSTPIGAVLESHLAVLKSILLQVALDERIEESEKRKLDSLRRTLIAACIGISSWLIIAVVVGRLTSDPGMDRFGATLVPATLILSFVVCFALWAAFSQRTISRFAEPTLLFLQRAHGYFAHLSPLSNVATNVLGTDKGVKPQLFADACEIIKVKQDFTRTKLEQARFSTLFAVTIASILATVFVSIYGSDVWMNVFG